MGVIHFMGLGRAVGAVTCAVDYIEKALDLIEENKASNSLISFFEKSGGINHQDFKGKIEAIVLFTSKEVIKNKIKAYPYKSCQNPGNVREEVIKNLKKIWKRKNSNLGRKVFWCELDIDNFQDCFDKIVNVAYRFCPPTEKQGKEIWCNLTGGTNAIALALLSMAQLTGSSTKHYLISQRKEHQKEIQVPNSIQLNPNEDRYFNLVPYLKTSIDTQNFYEILLQMEEISSPITTENLLSRLKGKNRFLPMRPEEFRRSYMLKLYGLGYTQFDLEKDEVELSETGKVFIQELRDLDAVCHFEDIINNTKRNYVEESKNWTWFQEIDNLDT